MKAELQQRLFDKYPKLFSKRTKETRDNLMYFGIATDDGWYWLIDNLCKCIQNYIDSNYSWVTERYGFCWLKKRRIRIKLPQVVAIQIKEKFGRLRFYLDNEYDECIEGMILLAQALSGTICEMCGATKDVGRTSGWIITICGKCHHYGRHNQKKWIPLAPAKITLTES